METAGLARQRDDALSRISSERDFKERQWGLAGGYDVNNPYSQAALLDSQRKLGHSTVIGNARRQLYAGSTRARQGGVDRRFAMGRHNLEEERNAALADFDARQREAIHGYETGSEAAQIGALERAEKAPIEPAPQAAPAGGGKGGGGNGRTRVRRKRGR